MKISKDNLKLVLENNPDLKNQYDLFDILNIDAHVKRSVQIKKCKWLTNLPTR